MPCLDLKLFLHKVFHIKKIMKKILWLVSLAFVCVAFGPDLQKKVIRTSDGFDVECYISPTKLKRYNSKKMYHWFRSGRLHQTVASAGGYVLHKEYLKYYRSNQIAEEGTFSYGLKVGAWRTWHENGIPKTIEHWRNGYRDGKFIAYDSLGKTTLTGAYTYNLKSGYWIDHITKDSTYYKGEDSFKERPLNLIERTLRKKDSLEKVEIKRERVAQRYKDSVGRVERKVARRLKRKNDSIARVKQKADKRTQKRLDSINKSKAPKTSVLDKIFKKKAN